MSREKNEAILYRLVKYSDSSAIASVFSRKNGKLKVFIPKAYTKKGGVPVFIPGVLDFARKQTDLHRFYSFEPDMAYHKYLDNHDIILRFHLIFEIFEGLYHAEMPDDKLYDLILKTDDSNFRKITLYIIYFMLRQSGVMYDSGSCAECSSEDDLHFVTKNGIYCATCGGLVGLKNLCDKESAYIIRCFSNSSLYRSLNITAKQEQQVLAALCAYTETVLEKNLKSLRTVFDMI